MLGYLVAPLFSGTRRQWIEVGPLDRFPVGQTMLANFQDVSPREWAGLTSATAVYVRHPEAGTFDVFAVNCTHLGCPVNWLPSAQLFLCPCHGGAYYRDGDMAAGPP